MTKIIRNRRFIRRKWVRNTFPCDSTVEPSIPYISKSKRLNKNECSPSSSQVAKRAQFDKINSGTSVTKCKTWLYQTDKLQRGRQIYKKSLKDTVIKTGPEMTLNIVHVPCVRFMFSEWILRLNEVLWALVLPRLSNYMQAGILKGVSAPVKTWQGQIGSF